MPRTAATQFEAFFFFVFGLIRGFEVVNGVDALHDDCSGADLGNDLLYALVGHRGLVQGVRHYASCVGLQTAKACWSEANQSPFSHLLYAFSNINHIVDSSGHLNS